MAIKGNSSDQEVKKEFKQYTGPVQVKVVACNPTQDELQKMGYKADKPVEYLSKDKNENNQVRLDFYVESLDGNLKSKAVFFIGENERTESTNTPGNFEFTNFYGKHAYGQSAEAIASEKAWFKNEGCRRTLAGEADFLDFLQAWGNLGDEDQGTLEDMKALFKGNFKEIQGIVKLLGANYLWVMATIKDKKYQNISNKKFGRGKSNRFAADFAKYAKDQAAKKYPIKDDWSVEFKEYVPVPVFADPEPGSAVGETAPEVDF